MWLSVFRKELATLGKVGVASVTYVVGEYAQGVGCHSGSSRG